MPSLDSVLIYESNDTSLLGIIEQVLNDNAIPYFITGGANTGLASGHLLKISVPKKYFEEAREIIKQLTG